jgi:hypothetical protein
MGPSLWARIQKAEYGVETPGIANEEEIQDPIFRGKGDANRFLGLRREYASLWIAVPSASKRKETM